VTTRAETIGPREAREAMAAIGASRSWLADRVVAPTWYHPAFGVLAGALIAVGEVHDWPLFYWAVVVYSVACGALMWINQRRVGVGIRYFRGRVSVVFALQVLSLGVLVGVACWLDLGRGMRGALLVAGVLAVPIMVVFGRWTDRALRVKVAGR
jgi:hypothetical protein